MFFDSVFQDPESVSKVLWLDEIQQAIDEANVDENRAKQCKPPPFFILPDLPCFYVVLRLKSFTLNFWKDLNTSQFSVSAASPNKLVTS